MLNQRVDFVDEHEIENVGFPLGKGELTGNGVYDAMPYDLIERP